MRSPGFQESQEETRAEGENACACPCSTLAVPALHVKPRLATGHTSATGAEHAISALECKDPITSASFTTVSLPERPTLSLPTLCPCFLVPLHPFLVGTD